MLANASHSSRSPTALSPHVTENIGRVLIAIRTHLHMDVAFVSEFLGTDRILKNVDCADPEGPIQAGDILPLAAGYCRHVTTGALPELIADTSTIALARSIPETAAIPIGAHLSVPIKLEDGRIFGTFCCFSHKPRPDLGERDLGLLRTFGQLLATDIAADVSAERLRGMRLARIDAAVRSGDPQVVFQPIRSLTDGSIVSLECLARFRSEPVRAPHEWFTEAHQVAVGVELELHVARKAVLTCAALPAPVCLSINFSPDTLLQRDAVWETLSGFDPRRLVLEITEHIPIADYHVITAALAPLRERGIRVAIDDAGAGYSSMRHILDMRPDIIKLDISLTRGVDCDPIRKALAAALGEFARRAGTTVVAEGIETEEELAVLRGLGFHSGQGFLLGRPQPIEELRLSERQDGTSPIVLD
jgi:EAL domain-containing protein (putative c-di-GMP-specific phosphodiesterase class I)